MKEDESDTIEKLYQDTLVGIQQLVNSNNYNQLTFDARLIGEKLNKKLETGTDNRYIECVATDITILCWDILLKLNLDPLNSMMTALEDIEEANKKER